MTTQINTISVEQPSSSRWLHRLVSAFACHVLQSHKWTCAAEQGIKATPEQLRAGVEGFLDYATMYCAKCGKVSDLSKAHQMVCKR